MERFQVSRRQITFVLVLIVLPLSSLVCGSSFQRPQANGTAVEAQDTPTPVTIPSGWKMSTDESGACQVAAPPDWQLGTDFFLAVEKADPGPFESAPGAYPPSGLALWGVGTGTPAPEGKWFQIRTSRVNDGQVCSAWRIKADTDFTDGEKSEMEQVGTTLQVVQ